MSDAILDELIAAVDEHYKDGNTDPLLLSRFGQLHPDLRQRLVRSFGSLSAAVKAAGEEQLKLLRPGSSRGREVIATPTVAHATETRALEVNAEVLTHETMFDRLPRAIKIAFCVRSKDGESVGLRFTPMPRYQLFPYGKEMPLGFYMIDEDLRHVNLDMDEATSTQKSAVWSSFVTWASRHGLEPVSA